MRHSRWLLVCLCVGLIGSSPSFAGEGPGAFMGVDLGVSEPTNGTYRAHVRTGATANPYVGYMLNNNLGLEGQLHFAFQTPDNDHRGFSGETQTTSLFGATAGPRLSMPAKELDFLGFRSIEPYLTAQGGIFTGLSGAVKQTSPGFSVGGGIDLYMTENLALSFFGRWNRAYQSARPEFGAGSGQSLGGQGSGDIRWATGGIGLKYDFRTTPMPPPPPPPPPPRMVQAPPPPPPVKKKIVLRSVHFDFDKSTIRADAKPVLDEAVETLKGEGNVRVVVGGYTDSVGSDQYNMKLSRRRADAVRTYLVSGGIPASRISVEAHGEGDPVATNETDDGRAQNRRVELKVE